jgi:hypothetical protein
LRILDLRGANHFISEVAAKVVGGSQVNSPPSEYGWQLVFHLSQTEETGFLPTVEFYEKVYIALEMRVTLELRSE